MELRVGDIAGRAGLADHLTALDGLALFHAELARMGIGGDVAVRMAPQTQIAVTLQLAARIGDHAILGGLDRGALRHRDVDAIVLAAALLGAERITDAALHRPAEADRAVACAARWRALGERIGRRSCDARARGRLRQRDLLMRGLRRGLDLRRHCARALDDLLRCRRLSLRLRRHRETLPAARNDDALAYA